jgi:hypothetical protein
MTITHLWPSHSHIRAAVKAGERPPESELEPLWHCLGLHGANKKYFQRLGLRSVNKLESLRGRRGSQIAKIAVYMFGVA